MRLRVAISTWLVIDPTSIVKNRNIRYVPLRTDALPLGLRHLEN